MESTQNVSTAVRIIALLINAFLLPGVGTMIVGKGGAGAAQLAMVVAAFVLALTFVGLVVAIPLGIAAWIWALVSVASGPWSQGAADVVVENRAR